MLVLWVWPILYHCFCRRGVGQENPRIHPPVLSEQFTSKPQQPGESKFSYIIVFDCCYSPHPPFIFLGWWCMVGGGGRGANFVYNYDLFFLHEKFLSKWKWTHWHQINETADPPPPKYGLKNVNQCLQSKLYMICTQLWTHVTLWKAKESSQQVCSMLKGLQVKLDGVSVSVISFSYLGFSNKTASPFSSALSWPPAAPSTVLPPSPSPSPTLPMLLIFNTGSFANPSR